MLPAGRPAAVGLGVGWGGVSAGGRAPWAGRGRASAYVGGAARLPRGLERQRCGLAGERERASERARARGRGEHEHADSASSYGRVHGAERWRARRRTSSCTCAESGMGRMRGRMDGLGWMYGSAAHACMGPLARACACPWPCMHAAGSAACVRGSWPYRVPKVLKVRGRSVCRCLSTSTRCNVRSLQWGRRSSLWRLSIGSASRGQ